MADNPDAVEARPRIQEALMDERTPADDGSTHGIADAVHRPGFDEVAEVRVFIDDTEIRRIAQQTQ